MKRLLAFIPLILSFMSCGKHSDGTSVWAEGLWLLLVLPAVGSFFFFRAAWISSKSGYYTPNPDKYKPPIFHDEPQPIWKHPLFWFGVGMWLIIAVVVIWVNAEK